MKSIEELELEERSLSEQLKSIRFELDRQRAKLPHADGDYSYTCSNKYCRCRS